jgi:hypothetical protein
MNYSFGPWTTAMNSGSDAQLSTFWKKRITMLPIVRHSSAVVTRRGRLLLTATAALALVLPTLHFSRAVVALGAEAEKPVAAGKPFRFILPGGLVAEVIGVGHNPSKGQPWWAPDGTLVAAPYEKVDSTTPSHGDEEVSREIAMRWIHKPQDVTVHRSLNSRFWSWSGSGAIDANGKELPGVDVVAGTFLKTQKTGNLNFKIAAGPWETLTENSGREWVTYNDKNHGYAVSPVIEVNGGTRLTIAHDVIDRDVRIVAVDHQGRETVTQDRGGGDVKGFSQLTVIFYKLPLKDIKAFRLQARKWQTVKVTDIALNPGEMTQPVVEQPVTQSTSKVETRGVQTKLDEIAGRDQFQKWQLLLDFRIPISLRRELSAIRHLELQLARERARIMEVEIPQGAPKS